MKNLIPYKCNFYRTKDGAEVDFVTSNYKTMQSFEVKFKTLDKPIDTRTLVSFNKNEGVSESYLINRNLTLEDKGITYIPGYLLSKLSDAQKAV